MVKNIEVNPDDPVDFQNFRAQKEKKRTLPVVIMFKSMLFSKTDRLLARETEDESVLATDNSGLEYIDFEYNNEKYSINRNLAISTLASAVKQYGFINKWLDSKPTEPFNITFRSKEHAGLRLNLTRTRDESSATGAFLTEWKMKRVKGRSANRPRPENVILFRRK